MSVALEETAMTNTPCPECGHPTAADATACANCGHAMTNGTVQPVQGPVRKPPPPPELAGLVIEKVPPEMIEEVLGPFDLEEFMAGLREIEETGGCRLEDFIQELEEEARRRE